MSLPGYEIEEPLPFTSSSLDRSNAHTLDKSLDVNVEAALRHASKFEEVTDRRLNSLGAGISELHIEIRGLKRMIGSVYDALVTAGLIVQPENGERMHLMMMKLMIDSAAMVKECLETPLPILGGVDLLCWLCFSFHSFRLCLAVDSRESNRRRESRLLTATLIATVTFGAGFTVPGGTRSDGKAVLNGSMYYKIFSLMNWFSFMASAFVIYNEILEKTVLPVRLVALLIQLSIGEMVVALAAGYAALQTGFRKVTTAESMEFIFVAIGVPLMFLLFPMYVLLLKKCWKQIFPPRREINKYAISCHEK